MENFPNFCVVEKLKIALICGVPIYLLQVIANVWLVVLFKCSGICTMSVPDPLKGPTL